ncbi:MAG: cell envelope integrity protein CreD [Proteobacteria bacterium]|nr:cell envelope integrity protein CreD [Pseudomonadota bacterium]
MKLAPLTTKVLSLLLVLLLLQLLLLRIGMLVDERSARQQEAAQGVAQALAGAQTLTGPLLTQACTETWTVPATKDTPAAPAQATQVRTHTPQTLRATTQAPIEVRTRGLFRINTYTADTVLDAQWAAPPPPPVPLHKDGQVACEPFALTLAVSDPRGIRSATVHVAAQPLAVQPGSRHPGADSGFHAQLPATAWAADQTLQARVTLQLAGTERLALAPAAQQTDWTLRSPWPHPSFGGRFLPTTREVDARGFAATWTVSALASNAAQRVAAGHAACPILAEGEAAPEGCADTLGVAFIDPVNPYVLADRATKYALLFVVLTLGCVALVEVLGQRRVHPVQYALVGAALASFFLLLLSLSEHLVFDAAYALAASACALLLAWYASHALGSRRAGLAFGGGVALLYALLWTLLKMEQAALALGSVLLFAALAAVMAVTRRVDWYALGRG